MLGLMVLRVVLAVIFLVAATWFQISVDVHPRQEYFPLFAVVAAIGLLTILYSLLLGKIRNLTLFTQIQVFVDIWLITVIVYVTGGIDSYLYVLYPLVVVGSCILLGKKSGYLTASISSIAYGLLMDLDYYQILPDKYKSLVSPTVTSWEDMLTTVATNILAFLTVAYLAGYLADRTERIEKELEEKEIDYERLEGLNRLIVDSISSGIMTLDSKLRVTSFNNAATAIIGYTLREVYYRDITEVLPGLEAEYLSAESGWRGELMTNVKDGGTRYLGFSVSKGQSEDAASIVIFQDLTEFKALEDKLRRDDKLKALGELSASLAHEIRNPLASISGSIQVLRQELKLDGDKLHLMEIVLKETERLNGLISDFLLFAKPASGKKERFSVVDVVDETFKIFRHSPEAMGLETVNNVEGDFFVEGDRRQIAQIFWNLFLNAAASMPDGGKFTVSKEVLEALPQATRVEGELDPDRRFIVIDIADTGVGIDPEDMDRLFDPFFSTKERGTGLGLALVHRIVESHGGTTEVRSTLGEGTVFRVILPLAEAYSSVA